LTPEQDLERKSSAVTLSDMEMFLFPELLYALVLANILSPRLWRWREDEWFSGLERMKPYRRISRLKQYIMDHYIFNLDLETWGLTTKARELARFSDFVDEQTLARSNALFGHEGDKYYFDMDIRTHFGLDQYDSEVIPYWKTETIEAMDAFPFREGYDTAAGECVSLSTLYAAALFVVGRIPLKDLYLMATPLHSQNFIDVRDGILTNNRRLVTKNMWFNGTALSAKARRALENERVTMVAHETGVIHTVYDEATIAPQAYDHFAKRLRDYLHTPVTGETLCNFLRHRRDLQRCFQFKRIHHGAAHYAGAETLFSYEHNNPYLLSDNTRDKLMDEVDLDEFQHCPLPGRLVINDLEAFLEDHPVDARDPETIAPLREQFQDEPTCADGLVEDLLGFCHVDPRLPDAKEKRFVSDAGRLCLDPDMDRDEMFERVEDLREKNPVADLAFYAYRDLSRTEPEPFLLAAVQRNPVSASAWRDLDEADLAERVRALEDASIYDGPGRLAQPDEVYNYGRGDGLEKAVLLANLLRARRPADDMHIEVAPDRAVLRLGDAEHAFPSAKDLTEARWDVPPAAT